MPKVVESLCAVGQRSMRDLAPGAICEN